MCQLILNLKNNPRLIINAVGLSRGGMACLLLAKSLEQNISQINRVSMNALLFDPVPGNSITSASMDFLGVTLCNRGKDMSKVTILKNVLALYPYQPLPSYALHAPILPKYHQNCKFEKEIILGIANLFNHLVLGKMYKILLL